MNVMNIKTKLILGIGMLAGMIILLVTLSVVNLQILTATEPDSPAANSPASVRLMSARIQRCFITRLLYTLR